MLESLNPFQQVILGVSGVGLFMIVLVFFLIAGCITIIVSGVNTFNKFDSSKENQVVKKGFTL